MQFDVIHMYTCDGVSSVRHSVHIYIYIAFMPHDNYNNIHLVRTAVSSPPPGSNR